MSDVELEPLDEDIAALVRAHGEGPALPDAVRARLGRRLELSTSLAMDAAPPPKLAAPASLAMQKWWFGAGGLAVGTLAGAGLHAAIAPTQNAHTPVAAHRTPVATVPEPVPLPPPVPEEPPAPASEAPQPETPQARVRPAPSDAVTRARTPVSDDALAEERALLEMARTALSRGDSTTSLASLREHAARFPHGRLGEEREALWIQALLRAGDRTAAGARAARFTRVYPQSLLLPAIKFALEQAAVTETGGSPESTRNPAQRESEEP